MNKITLLLITLITLITTSIIAQTATVNGVSYGTIAAAYTAAAGGDIIVIDGIFDEILTSNKAVSLQGDDPATDGIVYTGTGRVLFYTNSVSGDFSISNLTISGGNVDGNGGGLFVDKSTSSQITLSNLIVEDNSSGNNGGGISIVSANVNINNVILRNNSGKNGGGIHVSIVNGDASTSGANKIINMSNSLINNNTSTLVGGALYIYAGGIALNKTLTINMENTTIALNSATTTGGIGYAVGGQLADGSGLPSLNLNMTHVTCGRNTATGNAANFGLYFNRTHGGAANNLIFNAYNSIFVGAGTTTARGINFAFAQVPKFINNLSSDLNNTGNITSDVNNITGLTAGQIGLPSALTDEGGFSNVLALTNAGQAVDHCTSATGVTLPTSDKRNFLRDTNPDAGAFEYYNIWTGATNNTWTDATNWANGLPASDDVVQIKSASYMPTASSAIDVGNIILDSGTSFITSSTYTGNLVYNRNLATTKWYLVSSPVEGQGIDAFVLAEGLASGTGSNVGLSDYNNATPGYTYYQSGVSETGSFTSGDGRSIKLASTGDVSFAGTINTNDVILPMISNSNGFNLVGNPYPSYLAGNENADGTNNILTINSANLTENTLWFWNQNTDSYNQINQASAAFQIAPAQGFFLSASGSVNLSITEAMQSHQGTDNFQRTTSRPEMNITITNGTASRDADIFFIDGTTTGFDNGYDSSIFGGVPNEFAIYTHAVANGSGRNLGIQSLPNNNYENMIVPVGVNAASGSAITIEASTNNFPEGLKIFLEDKQDNSFTLLDADANFNTTLENDLNGIGRFYLHTTQSVLNTTAATLDNISVFKVNNSLRILGLQQGKASVKLFNILGRQVLNAAFESNGTKDISLPRLAKGVYIVQLETAEGKLNKKIILE
jgi:hypothetical protein